MAAMTIPSMDEGLLFSARQVRKLDRIAIEDEGIPGYTLMCRAGAAAFRVLQEYWPQAHRLAVVCGRGNNGGDGYVVARLALEAGMQALVLTLGDHGALEGDARQAADDYAGAGGQLQAFSAEAVAEADVLVDAALGTGLERELEGAWRDAVQAINAAGVPVLAVDIPSGLHADTGRVMGIAVDADATVTFIGRKLGLYLGAGPDHCGHIRFEDLGVPAAVFARVPASARLLNERVLAAAYPRRPRTAHKGDFGHVLVMGGAPGMAGAAGMAGMAALRVGAGLASVATHPSHAAALDAARPELICHAVADAEDLPSLLARATVIALGPGLGQREWSRHLYRAGLAAGRPLVLDADALNLLAADPQRRDDWILTPHPGEAARLLDTDSRSVQDDRLTALHALGERYGGVTVLKGAGTLIRTIEGDVYLCAAGNPGMATGGMGDVLTGAIAGTLAQGAGTALAAAAGVYAHALAGDAAAGCGERGLLATDLLSHLHELVNPL